MQLCSNNGDIVFVNSVQSGMAIYQNGTRVYVEPQKLHTWRKTPVLFTALGIKFRVGKLKDALDDGRSSSTWPIDLSEAADCL